MKILLGPSVRDIFLFYPPFFPSAPDFAFGTNPQTERQVSASVASEPVESVNETVDKT